ncbi:protein unc-93 homolog A isoform X4 [Bubalus bubalis]|uniref:protein unc-93 homolog A isoform X4 n=1 Tax=Bubalus bubalis TaxID=89462 RepID=UPI000DBC6312|nr:protein unc-93 homolog A isoform X4 [Bubalus bubalis]
MEGNLKNVLVLSFGFLLLFTAYGGLQSLQPVQRGRPGRGGAQHALQRHAAVLHVPAAHPHREARLQVDPRARHVLLRGLLAGQLLRQLSSGVWGNLISSLVFGQTPTQGTIPEEQLQACGASDCLMATVPTNSTKRPSQDLIYTLMGIYTGCGFLAVLLMAVFLEPVRDAQPEGEGEKQAPPFWSTLLSTFKLLRDKRLRLLILLPMLSGFEQAFLSGDYTRSYTTCALGIQFVGYVMICFGAVDALCSVLFGRLARHTGRTALFALGAVTQLACIIALLLWKPHPSQLPVFFVFPSLWGMADAVWQTQNNALFGVLFEKNKEAAFASYRLWEALGFVIAFGYSKFLCVSAKLYVLLGVLSAAMAAYGAVEYLESRKAGGPPAAERTNPAEEGATQTKL